jgi:hypothetical protein
VNSTDDSVNVASATSSEQFTGFIAQIRASTSDCLPNSKRPSQNRLRFLMLNQPLRRRLSPRFVRRCRLRRHQHDFSSSSVDFGLAPSLLGCPHGSHQRCHVPALRPSQSSRRPRRVRSQFRRAPANSFRRWQFRASGSPRLGQAQREPRALHHAGAPEDIRNRQVRRRPCTWRQIRHCVQ